MRTVSGLGRRVQTLFGDSAAVAPSGSTPSLRRLAAAPGRPLVGTEPGVQVRDGVRLDQVDGTTCGSAVLVALAAWAAPDELRRLDPGGPDPVVGGVRQGFGARYDARQKQVHRETNRVWPQALGTTPWAMVRWLARNVPAAGRYRVRLVDDSSAQDIGPLVAEVTAALAAGRPVPLLVGTVVPRHYCLALAARGDGGWNVYEPTSGQVRALDPALVGHRALAPVLGFDHLHAVLLPAA
ncbi:hypothetical protein ACFQ34_10405 [Pseudonocardia benzenivorans]|uniref:Peptidase C39-like domain-containing protein n=2 Tax=Pseudonocardia TaxID=1847 RepID=F4CVM5_PSEUX|nr:hypothetical protein [Pseudonocardia dioxanivorans]AEA24200.1 hypothetical protein Psed_1972 [Pseudonocardia dioxanivorans CB1190]GJF07351.1 hypothetical protein PSD17_62980 [Pseudonocardia sp. D17]